LTENGVLGETSYEYFALQGAPLAEDLIYFWLETGWHLPEGHLLMRREVQEVFLDCYPTLEEIHSDIEPWLEFNFRFHSKRKRAEHVPTIASWTAPLKLESPSA
jgi:hypothetical protein